MPLSSRWHRYDAMLAVSLRKLKKMPSVEDVCIIHMNLGQNVFQVCGVAQAGPVVFSEKLS